MRLNEAKFRSHNDTLKFSDFVRMYVRYSEYQTQSYHSQDIAVVPTTYTAELNLNLARIEGRTNFHRKAKTPPSW